MFRKMWEKGNRGIAKESRSFLLKSHQESGAKDGALKLLVQQLELKEPSGVQKESHSTPTKIKSLVVL